LNAVQKEAIKAIMGNDVTILHGCAGTGKTYIAVKFGLQQFLRGYYDKLIFTRPCVEAYGESLGFLPGTFNDKIFPYLAPMLDILRASLPTKDLNASIEEGKIVTLPLAFQRGVTFHRSYVVADEMQNSVPPQMRLLLTRLGEGSKIVVTGDPFQSDIPGRTNGLTDAIRRLDKLRQVATLEMGRDAIVRHPLIADIEDRYSRKLEKH